MDSSVRSTRIRAAGSSMGRLATHTSHFESGGGDSLAKAAPREGAPYRRPSLSIANRLGNPPLRTACSGHPNGVGRRRRGFIGDTVWYIVSALRARSEEHTSELQSHSDLVC